MKSLQGAGFGSLHGCISNCRFPSQIHLALSFCPLFQPETPLESGEALELEYVLLFSQMVNQLSLFPFSHFPELARECSSEDFRQVNNHQKQFEIIQRVIPVTTNLNCHGQVTNLNWPQASVQKGSSSRHLAQLFLAAAEQLQETQPEERVLRKDINCITSATEVKEVCLLGTDLSCLSLVYSPRGLQQIRSQNIIRFKHEAEIKLCSLQPSRMLCLPRDSKQQYFV